MKVLDPTYLRYVYDGLQTRTLSSENPSGLPNGLVGVYEEAFANSKSVIQRSKILEFFSVWVILKKDVSSAFMLPLLPSWTEDQVLECIAEYSRWFNSPLSGKYQLYHERLRTFVLQKVSADEFRRCNESVIRICREALATKSNDEWDIYALEHLSTHLLVPEMEGLDSVSLKTLAYDTAHWNRQIDISKGYDWTKKMHNEMMLWASKYDDEQVIECALNKVDLYHMEQNDAPRIVKLVAENDIETALQRIESFGGNDKEGLQRKFILFMLCFLELTFLESKDKPFRKEAIEKLLKHLEANFPVDYSILNWNHFFPSNLMFMIAFECWKLDLNFIKVYNLTEIWKSEWIEGWVEFNMNKYTLLLELTRNISDEYWKCLTLTKLAAKLTKMGRLDLSISVIKEAQLFASGLIKKNFRSRAFMDISAELVNMRNVDEALLCSNYISDTYMKGIALKNILSFLIKEDVLEMTETIIQDALKCAYNVSDESEKSAALIDIASEIIKIREFSEVIIVVADAISCARSITNEYRKCSSLLEISTFYFKLECLKESESLIQEALQCANEIYDGYRKNVALSDIVCVMRKQGMVDEAIKYAQSITVESFKIKVLLEISKELTQQGDFNKSALVVKEAIELARQINDCYEKSSMLKEIYIELATHGKGEAATLILHETIQCVRGIFYDDLTKSIAFRNILAEVVRLENIYRVEIGIKEYLKYDCGISDDDLKIMIIRKIATKLAKRGKIKQALKCALCISDNYYKSLIIMDIGVKLIKQGKFGRSSAFVMEALNYARIVENSYYKSNALKKIASELANIGDINQALAIMNEAFECAHTIDFDELKIEILKEIVTQLTKFGMQREALDYTNKINGDFIKNVVVVGIGAELFIQGKYDQSKLIMNEAIDSASDIITYFGESMALKNIAVEFYNQGKVDEASLIMKDAINSVSNLDYDDDSKSRAIQEIASAFAKMTKIEEALETANGIYYNRSKSEALSDIATELAKQGKIEDAIQCALDIIDLVYRNIAFEKIVSEIAMQGQWQWVQHIGNKVTTIADRQKIWKTIASALVQYGGSNTALQKVKYLPKGEITYFYLQQWVTELFVTDLQKKITKKSLNLLKDNIRGTQSFLQVYAQRELFFGNVSANKIDRLNKTLNIQWAINIKNKLI